MQDDRRSESARATIPDGSSAGVGPSSSPPPTRSLIERTFDAVFRRNAALPTQEREALAALEELPLEEGRIVNDQRRIIERFPTVDRIDSPNVHPLAPEIEKARRMNLAGATTTPLKALHRIRATQASVIAAVALVAGSFSIFVLVLYWFVF